MFRGFIGTALLALALLVASSTAVSADIGVRSSGDEAVREYIVNFTSGDGIDAISDPIPSCLVMNVFWDRGTVGAVSLYETDPDDVTVAAIEASTLIKAFTTSTQHGAFSPEKSAVRFVVDTQETTIPSQVRLTCSNEPTANVLVVVETVSGSGSESGAVGQWIFVTDTATRTLPSLGTPGRNLCYFAETANVLTINPAGSDVIVLEGTAQTGGVSIVSAGAAGNFMCLLTKATSWFTLGSSGVWATGS